METLTLASLRRLASLYRAEVDGAAEMLSAIVEERAHELPGALGVPLENLDRLREHDDPIAVLVGIVEGAPRLARSIRAGKHLEAAQDLAVRLARKAERRPGGHHVLDVELLGEALAAYPGRVVTFGERGSCGAARLRAILRLLREAGSVCVTVTREHIIVVYAGEAMRGILKLTLHPPVADYLTLIVPLDFDTIRSEYEWPDENTYSSELTSRVEADHRLTADPSRSAQKAAGDSEAQRLVPDTPETLLRPCSGAREHGPEARPRGLARPRGFAIRFVEALASAVLGGGP